jgi:hypothetical protein
MAARPLVEPAPVPIPGVDRGILGKLCCPPGPSASPREGGSISFFALSSRIVVAVIFQE